MNHGQLRGKYLSLDLPLRLLSHHLAIQFKPYCRQNGYITIYNPPGPTWEQGRCKTGGSISMVCEWCTC